MRAKALSTEFREYERVLWRVLLSLSKAGYFVPPDDARDVIHDFYVEAWDGLKERFDPTVANFSTYVAGAFHRFARRRAIQMDQARRRLVDIEELGELSASDPGPASTLERKQEVSAVRSALLVLPALQRTILLEHFGDAQLSERIIADRHSLSRHAVRSALAGAIARVAELFQQAMPTRPDTQVALQRWREGRSVEGTAVTLKLPVKKVREYSTNASSAFLSAVREATDLTTMKGEIMRAEDVAALRAALLEGSNSALQYLRENAHRLRTLLAETDDLTLEATLVEVMRHHPERLAEVYEVLLSDDEESSFSEVDCVIQQARTEAAIEVGEAFALMAEDLPSELVNWSQWFRAPKIDDSYREYLTSQLSVKAGGPLALELTRYAMTPETLAGAMRGLQILFDERLEFDEQLLEDKATERSPQPGEPVLWLIDEYREEISIPVGDVSAQIATGPFMPRLEGTPMAMTRWVLSAVQERPFFVPNYRFKRTVSGAPLAAALPASQRTSKVDLRALWTRPAPRAAQEMAMV